jgi:hypothetical protein
MASFGIAEIHGNVQSDAPKHDETISDPIVAARPATSEESTFVLNYELSCNWCEIAYELNFKFNDLTDECHALISDCKNTITHVEGLKVPHCYEQTKIIFTCGFNQLLQDILYVWDEMCMFPDDVQFFRGMVIQKACNKLSDTSVTYLENMLGYFKDRIDVINEELAIRKKRGQDTFVMSQQVNMPCTYEDY